MDLLDGVWNGLGSGGSEGGVEATDGDDDVVAIPVPLVGGDVEIAIALADGGDGDALDDGRAELADVALDVVDDLIFDHKALGVLAVVGVAGQAALVIGRDEGKAVPALAAPRVGDSVFLENDMVVDAALSEAVARRKSCLATADDDD